MGRPARYDVDSLLDGAVALAASGGPAAVTMTAVASAVGAPSGSVYHRFPTRAALLSALWLRTLERFHAGLLAAAAAGDPVTVAQHTITGSPAAAAASRPAWKRSSVRSHRADSSAARVGKR